MKHQSGLAIVWLVILTTAVLLLAGIGGDMRVPADAAAPVTDVIGVTALTGLAISPAPMQVIANDTTILAVGSNQPISATAAVGTSRVQTRTATSGPPVPKGQVLILTNIGSQTITITDTGTTMLSGNAVLGQYDDLMLMFDGTNWLQIGKTDN